ncbi:MAG: menaquinone biosynthesis decarboxylase [Rikenellaceae bacterium]|nr:menaquinone biosynthesis decarboxylase [Rikenellaceae bacterium]
MYSNLREYIDRLEREGELIRISAPVSTRFEIAELTDRVVKSEGGGKALLFENTGTKFPVVTNMMGSSRRIAMALGVERLDDISARIDSLLKEALSPKGSLWEKMRALPLLADVAKWFPQSVAGRGACQQVVWQGDEVDLERLPMLHSWEADGGAFVTLPMVNTLDPETGMRNVGMYRMQRLDKRSTGMHWHIHKTGARHYDAYKRLGERMPVVVTLGGDPAYTYAATAPMPDNMDEYLLAGFLRQRPVRLVKALTCDIRIPEDCDFVIEGYVDPSEEKIIEGDFGDHTGFYSLKDLYPRFHVTCITHRRDAIYPATVVGVPPQEDAYIAEATERIFLAPIRLAVQPEVRDLWMPVEGTAHNLAIVSIDKRYEGQAHKVAQSLWGAGQMMFNKYMLIASAEDNIRSFSALGRLLRRVDLERDVIRTEGILDVLDHATATCGFGGKLAIDLTGINPNSPVDPISAPRTATPCGGISLFDTRFTEEYGLLLLFADECGPAKVDVEEYLRKNNIHNIKYIALFDYQAAGPMTPSDLLWLAMANSDPRRDVRLLSGGELLLDARSKHPGVGQNPKRFPNVVMSSTDTIRLVDERWAEYGLGEKIESPSRRYRKLWLSPRAEW